MYQNCSIGVVVPCYNEETQIEKVLATMPDFVDQIIVVDDVSKDRTSEVVQAWVKANGQEHRVTLIRHPKNKGVGGAIATGYKEAVRRQIDATAVMAGDGQMDPTELAILVEPVTSGAVDYVKGNRLFYVESWAKIPKIRFFGNSILSLLTKIASGYWHSADSQTGYTVASLESLKLIDLDNIYPRYGCPNDILVQMNIFDQRVMDVPIRPVYNVGEKSKIRLWKVIPTISKLLVKLFMRRLVIKYVIRDFHPLVLFYVVGSLLFVGGALFGTYLVALRILRGPVAETSSLFAAMLVLAGMQLLLFGMWFDMDFNQRLCIRYRRVPLRLGTGGATPQTPHAQAPTSVNQ